MRSQRAPRACEYRRIFSSRYGPRCARVTSSYLPRLRLAKTNLCGLGQSCTPQAMGLKKKYADIYSLSVIIVPLSQIHRSMMLVSNLTTCIPQADNNVRYFLHYFTSKRLFLSSQFEKKQRNKDFREEQTWTEDHSIKNLRSTHLGYLRVDDCRLKKVDQTISDRTATD